MGDPQATLAVTSSVNIWEHPEIEDAMYLLVHRLREAGADVELLPNPRSGGRLEPLAVSGNLDLSFNSLDASIMARWVGAPSHARPEHKTPHATHEPTEKKRRKPRLRLGEEVAAVVVPPSAGGSSRKWTVPEATEEEKQGWVMGPPPESMAGQWLLIVQEATPTKEGLYAQRKALYAGENSYMYTRVDSVGAPSSGFAKNWDVVMWRLCLE
jgi:hypothetical protein